MKCHRVITVGATVMLVAALTADASATTATTWTQERASADRRGWITNETSISAKNVTQLRPRWGWGVKVGLVHREPVVVGDRLYTVTPDGSVAAVDTSTGAVLERTAPDAATTSSRLASAGSLLYLTEPGPALGTACGLYAFDRSTMRLRWATPTDPTGAPVCDFAVEGNLAVVVSSHHDDARGDYVNRLTFLNATTGKIKSTMTYEAAWSAITPPTLLNGVAYVGDQVSAPAASSPVRAFGVSGPLPSWTGGYVHSVNQPLVATPEAVYAVGSDGLRAFNPTTGAQLWAQLPGADEEWVTDVAMAVDGERVYLEYMPRTRTTNQLGQLVLAAVNRSRGGFVWSSPVDGGLFSPPVVANGLVYATAGGNVMTARKAATGKLVWEQVPVLGVTPADAIFALTLAGGRLYAAHRAESGDPVPLVPGRVRPEVTHAPQYPTSHRHSPWGGASWPTSERSRARRIARTSPAWRRPTPMSTSRPTIERTIWWQNALARMSNHSKPSPASVQAASSTRRSIVGSGSPDPTRGRRQNDEKSCSPISGSHASCSRWRAIGAVTCQVVAARKGSGASRLSTEYR